MPMFASGTITDLDIFQKTHRYPGVIRFIGLGETVVQLWHEQQIATCGVCGKGNFWG